MDAIATITSADEGKTYTIPESRVGCAQDARETLNSLVKAEEERSKKRAKFSRMLNGNPPYDPGKLTAAGLEGQANFTQREAEGFMSAAKTPYYALAFKADRFVQLTLDYGNADAGLLQEWAGKISTRYQYALEDWTGLDTHMQRSQFQMIGFSNGPMVWEDTTDWRSSSRNAGDFMLPDDASADIEDWETAGCKRSYLPTKLWALIKNEDAATKRGWNVPACKRAIMMAASEKFISSFGQSWEYYEAEMRKGATGWDSKSKRIFVGDIFQKEFSGGISHFIVAREEGTAGAELPANLMSEKEEDKIRGFLFRKLERFDSFSEIICPFLYDVGPDGQWHSVKGAGPKIFDYCSASDRLMMATLDGAMKASGIVLKATDSQALQDAATTPMTGSTVVGPKYEVVQQRVHPDLQAPLAVKNDLGNTLSRNTGQYRAHFVTDDHAPTLGQEELNAAEQNVLADGDASRYYKYLDRFHKETFRRLLAMGKKLFAKRKNLAPVDSEKETKLTPSEEGALKFYKGCIQDGIPEEVLVFENFCRIRATRLIGNGSAQMQQIIGKELVSIAAAADERGRRFAFRNHVMSIAGITAADAMFPPYDTPQIVDSHMSLATLENNFLRMPGGKVMVDSSQDNVTHFGIHLQGVQDMAQQVQNGQTDPRALLVLLEQAGPHMFKHIEAVQGDPSRKSQVESMMDAWQGMSKMADQLAQQIEEADRAAAAEQPAQAPDPEIIKALAEVRANYEIEREKMLLKHGLKAQDQQFKHRIKDASTAHDFKLKNFTAVTDARRQPEMAA